VDHIFLAGVSAKLYFGLYPELVLPTAHEGGNAMPRVGCLHRFDPFQIAPEEAGLLATSIDPAIAKALSRMSPCAILRCFAPTSMSFRRTRAATSIAASRTVCN
jgi:hypothetical protein